MEDIRKKLDPKQVTLSPLPVTEGALNKLKDVILSQVAIPTTQNRESIQLLWEQCQSEHRVVAYNAVRILLELVDNKVLELGPTLSGLSALSYQIKHPEGLVWAISQLLAIHSPKKYALVSNPHPYVVLLRSYPATWPHIHNVIQNQMNRAQTNGNNLIEDLRPLLMFLFCNPHHHEHFSGFRQILLADLIQAQPNLQLKPFWEDVLQWLPFNSKVSAYEQYRMSLQIWSELGWDQPTLLPSLCSVIVTFSRFGLNPDIVIKDITNKWEASKCADNIANESVIILSSALSETSSYQQRGIIELILSLCEKAQMIPEVIGLVLFQILVFVSKKTQITQRLVEQIETLKALSKSKPVSDLSIVSTPIAPFHVPWAKARQVFNLLRFISGSERSTTQWLKSIERLNLGDFTDEVPVLSSIAILTDSGEQLILIMRIFGQAIGVQPEYALQVLAVLMHKLAQKTEPETKLALLTHIPMLGKDKLSIGVTVQLINSLGSRPGLICLKIKLLYDLWLIEDRIYPQLRKALDENTVMKTAHEYEFFLTKALVLKGVCEKSPSKHGADLLPMLSDILNKFGDPIDSALCCMALDGIRSLCEAQIIDIRTTVNVLWSKLWNDGRLRVRSHFYQILRVTALFDLESAVFQEFKSETLTRLWERLVLPGQGEDIPAISQAIVGFKLQDHKLKMLPSYVIENLKYPDGFIPKDDTSLPPKPEHVWEVIPSDIWTKLMTDCPIPELQDQFKDLLVHLLDEELKGLPRGAYYLSQAMKNRGEEPENYGFLKEGSILRGLISGSSAGRYEVFIIGPTGKRFRSKNELKTFFEKTGERSLNPEDFDFSTFGTGRTTLVTTPSIQTKANPVSAPSVVGSTPTSTVLASKPSTVPQPIVSSRPSVSSHPQSQVSLPQTQVMTPTILQPQPSISNPPLSSEGLPNLLQSITQPLPPKSLQIPPPHTQPVVVSSAPSGPVTPLYQSQISMETADADAQISQLIETLQKDPQHLTIESDKMADFLKSFQQEAETPTSGPPNIASLLDQGNPSTSTPPSSSMSPPILKPSAKLMPSSSASTEDKGQCSSDEGSKPERTTGTTGFQASFLNSLANRRVSSDEDSSSSSPATPQQKQQQLPPPSLTPVSTQFNSLPAPVTSVTSITSPLEPPKVLPQMSRGEMVPATLPPTSVPVTVNPSITMGGASTQMRAVQSLPPNTRLVRGPNGQYTLQKVQTIELSPEMQQSLKLVQNKIQEIDQKPTKSPLDEAELAQLQTKQQQILATGRPIIAGVQPPTPGGQGNLVPSRLSNPVSVHQQLSLSTVTRVVPSGQQSSFVANILPGQQVQPPVVPTPKIPVPSVSLPSTIGLPASNMGGSAAKPQVPHLTDQQKRIVAEFKQKMGLLPQEQQASFIAQHKSDLIKQLNFDPSQIQLLKGTSTLQQRVPIPSGVVPNPSLPAAKVILPGSNSLPVVQGGGVSTPIVLQQVVPTEKEAVPAVGLKRPSSGLDGGGPPVKHKKTAWVESQVRKDQNEALNANYNVNFKSTEDACKRLLRYHVFGELDPNPMEEEQAQVAFEDKAEDLISKYQTMMDKYHYLLIQESMREASSSEDVMLSRLWDSDERLALAKEKEEVKSGKLLPLPPLPESWSSRYEELYGQKPPAEGLHPGKILELEESLKPKKDEEPLASEPVVAPSTEPIKVNHTPAISNGTETVIDRDDDEEEEKDEDGKFVGLKISRSQSGSWSKQKHPSGGSSGSRRHLSGEDPLEASMRKLHQTQNPLPVTTASEDDGSSSDEEFSLKDIDTSQAVGSILAEDHHEEFDLGFGRYDTPTMSGEGDADSVQNAINSILDLPQGERMETPDLSNITGLLDSMEEEGEHAGQDAVTEAAVNSIPRF